MPKTAKEHRELRAELITKAQAFNAEKEDKETGLMSAEDDQTFSQMMSDASDHLQSAKRVEQLETASATLGEDRKRLEGSQGGLTPGMPGTGGQTIMIRRGNDPRTGQPRYIEMPIGDRGAAEYKEEYAKYLKLGKDGLGPERMAALRSDDDEQAGYLVASEQYAAGLLKEVDDLLFVRQHAKVHTMIRAKKLGIRKRTKRLKSFDWGSELSRPKGDNSLKYGKKVLEPHYGTGAILVSNDLLRNSDMMVESEIRAEMARDSGEGMEDAYFFGDGKEKPLGIYVDSVDGITAKRNVLTGSATGFSFDGLLSAKYALKAQYRNGTRGTARWLFHRKAIEIIAKIKDNEGQPIFRVGGGRMQDNYTPEDMILGFGVDESERAPNTFQPGSFVGSLQNWQYYEIADALDMEIQKLMELYAESNQCEYLYRLKTDGMPTLEEAFVRLEVGA